MAGHSKWANIKFRKAGQDAKRGKLFTKLAGAIILAAKQGGPEPDNNPSLRNAIDKALAANMTRDAVERAIKRATGNLDGKSVESIRYEGYGPEGVAIMVDCMTDNRNRTVSEVRHAFSKHGGNLGTDGSVSYMFNKVGHIFVDSDAKEEELFELAIEAGADDVEAQEDGSFFIQVDAKDLYTLKDTIVGAGMKVLSADENMISSTMTNLGIEESEKVMKLVDRLEELDDVQNVYTNADFAEEFLAQM